MKSAYYDTNVVVSTINPNDPFFAESKQLLTSSIVRNISSVLLLVELKSVLAKQIANLEFTLPEKAKDLLHNLSLLEKVEIFFNYIIDSINLEIYENTTTEQIQVSSQYIIAPAQYTVALRIAANTQLRTLDNLHIAQILLLERNPDIHIDYFVTGDEMIRSKKKQLNGLALITTVTPAELLNLES